jgi:2-C-methyl-D-erythritol 4-phosphate cytidylyltransferase
VDTVVVHDAARPLAGAELVATVLARLEHGDVDGVVPVLPVRDTIKRVEGDLVMTTLTREGLVTVQTPQAFRRSVLWEAHAGSDRDAPDDAALVEQAGGKVAVVEGDPRNLKITYAEDLRIAEALLG